MKIAKIITKDQARNAVFIAAVFLLIEWFFPQLHVANIWLAKAETKTALAAGQQPTGDEVVVATTYYKLPEVGLRQPRYSTVVPVTAYNSTPEQTDSTPFVTAKGTQVRPGIVAANFLPFGTQIRIPQYFGDQIFVVEDRMNERFDKRIDIWMENGYEAKDWGVRRVEIEVL